ncbi:MULTISPECIES: diguanylate cyclase [unclassified Leptolyngbya]|uniref:GGDEF domain-containing response regulator n=1 Tax=unclassified Leptolyngbya TaxID=2650499 RepID=UPI0016893C2C|nr:MULTISPECIES: diguanylate cyclase [unclassified Leptolyngbya]MBD1910844.1 diguanylate cyclase [Leptolyngbya sp. FACHB-8]MBD2153761.1 diguanylate cyclase [Leptolyngbya sp. FACHB-16]
MDASILIVGSDDFVDTFSSLVEKLSIFAIQVASHPREAMSLVQAQQPDLLLLQASELGVLDLCQQIKSQSQLAWIYCIVIQTAPTLGHMQLSDPTLLLQAEIQALQMGADALLNLPIPLQPESLALERCDPLVLQRLYAQLHAGQQRVQNHRDLMRTNDLLSAIALVDPLTELNNRRAFEWELPRQIQNSRDREVPISLLMLDIDYFKRINDTYGHVVGDRALKLVSARLRHNLRFYDTPFRYGGEEFVILLSDTGADEVGAIATRICDLISSQPFSISDSLELTITISAGVSSLQSTDDNRGVSLLHRADQNLLRAKARGRNQVVLSDPPTGK